MDNSAYLRPDVKIEPLRCGWYAWTHLISPAQHALNLVFRQMPLLQSFLKNPSVHVAAAADRKLFGGPFVDLPASRAVEVRELIERTLKDHQPLIRLANDLRELDRTLQESATGYSMADFYARLPATLQGLVELVYDLNHHPKLRLYEELLYDEIGDGRGEEILLSTTPERERPFFMSTPRLVPAGALVLPVKFADPRLDELARARTHGSNPVALASLLGVPPGDRQTFEQLFTRSAPAQRDVQYTGSGVRLRYFGHACVLIQTSQTSILLDPLVATENHHADGRLTFHDLPERIDYAVISHNHQDHCVPEMLLQLRSRIGEILVPASNRGNLADPSLALMLGHMGFRNVRVLAPFDTVAFADGHIASLPFPGEHVDLDVDCRQGLFIEACGRRFAFLVDSDGADPVLFRRIARRIGGSCDALFLGMECHGAPLSWLYGPLLTKPISRRNDESRRLSGLNCERAAAVLQELAANRVFVYAMGQEPWLRFIMGLEYEPDSVQLREMSKLLGICRERGIPAENLFLGRTMEF